MLLRGAVLCEGLGSGWGRPLQLHRHRDAHPLSVQKPDGERSGLALPVGPGKQIEGPGPIGVVLHRQGICRTLRPGEGPGPAQVHGLPGGEGVLPEEPQGPASRVCVPYSTQCSSSIFRSSPGRGGGLIYQVKADEPVLLCPWLLRVGQHAPAQVQQ